jgi:WG containing repeat
VIEPTFDAAMPFSEGVARVLVDGKWGYIDREGNFSINPRYTLALDFRSGVASASVENRGPFGFIDRSGSFCIEPAYTYPKYFAEGLAAVTLAGQSSHHFINMRGERAFPGEYLGAHEFRDGLSRVSTLETIAYIDHQGKTVWEGPFVDRP